MVRYHIILAYINFSDAFYRVAVFAFERVPQAPYSLPQGFDFVR